MDDAANGSNFFSSLTGVQSKKEIADLYSTHGWKVREAGWDDYELRSSNAELILEAENPILMHGFIEEIQSNVETIMKPLVDAGVEFKAECYNENHELLREFRFN